MIANQPAINNISYSNTPKIEFRIENADPILNQYRNLSIDKALDKIMEKAVLNPFYFLTNKANESYQTVKKSQVYSDVINENIKKSLYNFKMPSKEESEWSRTKFLPQDNFFQIPFLKIEF